LPESMQELEGPVPYAVRISQSLHELACRLDKQRH